MDATRTPHGEFPFPKPSMEVDGTRTLHGPGGTARLTPSGARILRTLLSRAGETVGKRDLLASSSDSSVNVHVHRLRAALARAGYGNCIGTAHGAGYVLLAAPIESSMDRLREELATSKNYTATLERAIDDVRTHADAWVDLISQLVCYISSDSASSETDRSYVEHELKAAKRDLGALIAAFDTAPARQKQPFDRSSATGESTT